MIPVRIARIATLGFFALLPLTLSANSASAAHRHHHSHFDRYRQARLGTFMVAMGTTKSIGNLQTPAEYVVCASHENSGPIVVHYDGGKYGTLLAGDCHDYEAAEIKIENPGQSGFAHGTFAKRDAAFEGVQ